MELQQYSAALVGLGRVAWRFDGAGVEGSSRTHMGSYLRNAQTNVICGCSPAAKDRFDFQNAYNVETVSEFSQVLAKRPSITSICSPSENHYTQTLACLDQEVPMVWLEKPPTLTLEELDKLIGHVAYRSGRTKILVNYLRRYSQRYERFRAIYREQLLGRPVAMQLLYSQGLEMNGSHFLDFIFWLTDGTPPEEVIVAQSERLLPNPTFSLRFASGLVIAVCGHEVPYHVNDVVMVGETGRVSLLSGGLETRIEKKIPNERHAGFFRLQETKSDLLAPIGDDDPFSAALSDLIEAHQTNRQPLSNLLTARPTLSLLAQIRRE
jgi:predicted dehydrogenase